MGAPKTTFRFNDLLDGFTELRKAVMFPIAVYYRERILVKISKDERHIVKSPGGTRHKLLAVLSQWSCVDRALSSQQQCVTTRVKYCQPGKHWRPGFY